MSLEIRIHDPDLTLTGWMFLNKIYIIVVLWLPETTI